jgi:hypothetical protein
MLRRCATVLGIIIPLLAAGGVYATEDFTRITLTAPTVSVRIGDTIQLRVIGTKADASEINITQGSTGTKYSTPEELVSITADGLVSINGARFRTTHESFLVWVIANNGSAAATIPIAVIPTDADGDEMEDDFERRHGLNPADPADAARDNENDGLTNLKEFQFGTNPGNRDSDGDGIPDGEEIRRGSDPLNANSQFALNQDCLVSVLNRTSLVKIGGSWSIPNVPTNMGQVRARVNCVNNGITISGQSDFFTVPTNGTIDVFGIHLATPEPVPQSLTVTSPAATLTSVGATAQLTVTAIFSNQTTRNVTAAGSGTTYTSSNPAVATISADGAVTARASGIVVISALNDGAIGIIRIQAVLTGDSDGDGIPDDVELSLGLNAQNAIDAQEDADRDGLTNLQEFQQGTDMRRADSDGDGLSDGDEFNLHHTNPLVADTDGDGLSDGLEIQTASNPLDPNSFNLARALQSMQVTPGQVVLIVNSIIGEASQQLAVTGRLIDGNSINLASRSRGTNYSSSNLGVANFGGIDGRIFAGSNGVATVTVTNSGFSATVTVNVSSFSPTVLSFVTIPGFANNVDVSGNFAYVAAGTAGLHVLDITDRRAPRIVGTLDTPGNANDVKVVGSRAYIADGAAGLRIVNVSNPLSPTLLGSLDTPGTANDITVVGDKVYVADGATGLQIIGVSDPAAPTLLGSINTPGDAKGVDVSGNLAVIADTSTARVVDISNSAAPSGVGAIATTESHDVTVDGSIAYIADFEGSLRVIDFSVPATPRLLASTSQSLGGILLDVAKARDFIFGADVFFVNGVPIINVADPANPVVRAQLNFPARDDNGTGIAVDNFYVYLTADRSIQENGVSGDSRLYIGQYVALEDKAGIAPVVSITSPAAGTTVIEGTTLHVVAQATDDIQVVSVDFLLNGAVVFTDSVAPYEFDQTVPTGSASLSIGARAVDLGSNVGVANNIQVNVIPDPGTTVAGRVLDRDGNPVAGATVTTNGSKTATTTASGTFTITGVPTIFGNIVARARATVNGEQLSGASGSFPPVAGGLTNVGDITIRRAALFGSAFSGPTGPSTFYSIDAETGAATAIGPIGFTRVGAMAFDASGTLYAIGRRPSDGRNVLITINTATGAGTEVGLTGVETLGFGDTISDISFRHSDGALYAYLEAGDGLGVINKQTGAVTALGRSFVSCCGNGMAFSPGDVLFHSNEDSLHTLDQVTGRATLVTNMVFSPPADNDPRINGMDFQPATGILFGSLNDGFAGQPENYLVTVNTTTGVVTIIGRTVNGLDGIAFAP